MHVNYPVIFKYVPFFFFSPLGDNLRASRCDLWRSMWLARSLWLIIDIYIPAVDQNPCTSSLVHLEPISYPFAKSENAPPYIISRVPSISATFPRVLYLSYIAYLTYPALATLPSGCNLL